MREKGVPDHQELPFFMCIFKRKALKIMSNTTSTRNTDAESRISAPPARVVIQGVRGAFHEMAARKFLGDHIEIVPALSFRELFVRASDPKQSDMAVLAIENSIAGSIIENYLLLESNALHIVGEVFLPIHQNLMALPGVRMEDIEEVHSHPMALAQCAVFFEAYPHIRLVSSDDTAASAAEIVQKGLRHRAAIASELAAQLYHLDIIAPSIETDKQNYTRFYLLQRDKPGEAVPKNANKASVCFSLQHESGSLANILNLLARAGANLTKIQSLPLLGQPWEYRFFVDFTSKPAALQAICAILKDNTHNFKTLGTYTHGQE